MQTWQTINQIRVVRSFADKPIEEGHVTRILNAGRRAGSSKNQQRWAFVVVREKERLRRLAQLGQFGQPIAGAAVAIALVTPDPRSEGAPLSIVFDVGRAAQNMVLAAWDLGIGSVPTTVYDHEAARALLAFPEDHHCEYVLAFGYPADSDVLQAPKRTGGRARLEDIVHTEHW
ncbi:MAG: nitroreductase family protein [Actinomycetota bacterium]